MLVVAEQLAAATEQTEREVAVAKVVNSPPVDLVENLVTAIDSAVSAKFPMQLRKKRRSDRQMKVADVRFDKCFDRYSVRP